jgi:hypothetical protein
MDFQKLLWRVARMLYRPKTEWTMISDEPVYETQELIRNYALPLVFAAVFWDLVIVGITTKAVFYAMLNFMLSMLALFITTSFVYELAPRFQATLDRNQASKLVMYASTPLWIIGMVQSVFRSVQFIKPIGLIFALYLYTLGTPLLMKPNEERQPAYIALIGLCVLMIELVLWLVLTGAGRFLLESN